MTYNSPPSGPGDGPGRLRDVPPPPVTIQGARQVGFSDEEYRAAAQSYRMLWQRHINAGLEGAPEVTASDRAMMLGPAVPRVQEELADGAEERLDETLTPAGDDLRIVQEHIEKLEGWRNKAIECGAETLTLQEATAQAADLSSRISRDEYAGLFYHRRVGFWWQLLSTVLVLLDLGAIMVIFADLFNIDIADPLSNWAEMLAVVALPIIMVIVQLWTATMAGTALNEHREHDQTANPGSAAEARAKATAWLYATGAVALALTSLLIVRLVFMALDADLGVLWMLVLILLALAIGVGAPLVKVYVEAEDSSTFSRRRDEIEKALRKERKLIRETLDRAVIRLNSAAHLHEEYRTQARPAVVEAARVPLRQAENSLRLLGSMLGVDLGVAMPGRPRVDVDDFDAFPLVQWDIPGAPVIDNEMLLQRDQTYEEQLEKAAELHRRLAALGHGVQAGPRIPVEEPTRIQAHRVVDAVPLPRTTSAPGSGTPASGGDAG